MKLIVAKPSPYARKARIALHEKDIPFEEIVDVPWNPDTVATAHNPLGKIPVLILDDGRAYYDSRVIVEYTETIRPEPRLLPKDPLQRVEARQVEALADGICDATVLTVLEESRVEALRSKDWMARQRAKVERGTEELARLLAGRRRFIGDAFSIADVAAGCTLAYMDVRLPGFDWRGRYPDLVGFSAEMEARPSFARTRPEPQTIQTVA